MENDDGENANNVYYNIEIGEEELELKCERTQTTGDQTQEFSTRSDVESMIPASIENSTYHRNAPVLAVLAEDKLIDALQAGHEAANRRIKTPSCIMVEKVIVDIIQMEKMDSLLIRETEPLT